MKYNETNIETYLTDLTVDILSSFEGEVFWNRKNKSFEIYGTIYGENENKTAIQDVDEVVAAEEIIDFSDAICFYEEGYPVEPSEFLKAIPYNRKKGIAKKELLGVVHYFKEILEKGQADLNQFIKDPLADVFELTFQPEELEKYIQQFQDEKGSVPYPKF